MPAVKRIRYGAMSFNCKRYKSNKNCTNTNKAMPWWKKHTDFLSHQLDTKSPECSRNIFHNDIFETSLPTYTNPTQFRHFQLSVVEKVNNFHDKLQKYKRQNWIQWSLVGSNAENNGNVIFSWKIIAFDWINHS